ncbi:MAG: FAD-binding oxidoreductase [Actinobacteria bacterium]|nr:MAG: FAD-binding oxidoreductase [Actinomycetota bacterium]
MTTGAARCLRQKGSSVDRADAVVIGGGILGASAALHLVEAGVKDVLLVERDGLAQGTSSAGAGFIGMWGAGYIAAWAGEELEMEEYGLSFYAQLADEGYDFGFKRNGNLWAVTTEDTWRNHLVPLAASSRVTDKRILGPEEIEQMTGIVSAAGVLRGLLHPSGGYVSAPLATLALADRFRRSGGRIALRRPVDRILVQDGRVIGVMTDQGRIASGIVVVACGAWSNNLVRELGIWLPMVPLVASRIITENLNLPASMPTIMFPEFAFIWLREENGALLWGVDYNCHPHAAFVDGALPERFDQLPLDGVLYSQQVGTQAAVAIPVLLRYRSLTVAHGTPCFTPDQRGIIGGAADITGLYVIGGCNEGGVSHAPGWGRLIAELVVSGVPSNPVADAFSPQRFSSDFQRGQDVLEALHGGWGSRAPESDSGAEMASVETRGV